MKHTEIIRRDDGSRVMIEVRLYVDPIVSNYSIDVSTCKPKKRTWVNVVDEFSYSFRKLAPKERREFRMKRQLEVATLDEINNAIEKCWMNAKPKPIEEPVGCDLQLTNK
jgi:hypothetical protein